METDTHARNGLADVKWIELAPIVVTLLSGLLFQMDILYTCLRAHWRVHRELASRWRLLAETKDAVRESRVLLWNSFKICFLFSASFSLIAYTCLQAVRLHYCKTSLWNLDGCVTVAEIDRYKAAS